jgi:hypothetical protein
MILHVFTITKPDDDIQTFPPSVMASGWTERFAEGSEANGAYARLNGTQNTTLFLWDNETELTNYVNTYRLTDPTLISDLNAWKAAHGISFSTEYHDLSGSSITIPDVVS